MLILDEPTLAHIHPRDWDKKLRYKDGSFANSLAALTASGPICCGFCGNYRRRTGSVAR